MAAERSVFDATVPEEELLLGREPIEPLTATDVNETLPRSTPWVRALPASRVAIMAVVDDFGDLVPIPSASELLWELKARWKRSRE